MVHARIKDNMNYSGNNETIQSMAFFIDFLVFNICIFIFCYAMPSIAPCYTYNLTKNPILAVNFAMPNDFLVCGIVCLCMISWIYYQFSKFKSIFAQLKDRRLKQGLPFLLLTANNIFISDKNVCQYERNCFSRR